MDDLISRQALCEYALNQKDKSVTPNDIMRFPPAQSDLDEWCPDCKEYDSKRHCCPRLNRVIRTMLKDAQSVRKKAKWIDGQCSNCGCDVPAYIIDWKWQKDMDAKFCPNCGADMRGESE